MLEASGNVCFEHCRRVTGLEARINKMTFKSVISKLWDGFLTALAHIICGLVVVGGIVLVVAASIGFCGFWAILLGLIHF